MFRGPCLTLSVPFMLYTYVEKLDMEHPSSSHLMSVLPFAHNYMGVFDIVATDKTLDTINYQ